MRDQILKRFPIWRRRILLVVVAGVPLLFVRTLNDPINVPKLSLLMIGVTLAAALRAVELLQGANRDSLKLMVIPVAAIAVPLLIATVLSPYRWWALFGHYPRFAGLIPYVFTALLGVLIADAFVGDVRSLAWAFAGAGALAGLYALIQFAGLDPFEWSVKGKEAERVVVSTLGNPNFAGAFFAITAPVGVALALTDRHRAMAVSVSLLCIIGLVAARSEAAWAAGLAGLVIVIAGRFEERFPLARFAAFAIAGAVALVVAGSVVAAVAGVDRVPETIGRRGEWWIAAARMTKTYPVAGRGPNAFALEHPRFRTIADGSQVGLDITDDPHSVILSFATAAGGLGVVGYALFAGWGIAAGARRDGGLVTRAFTGAFVAYLIQGLVSVDTVALRAAGWVSLGALVATLQVSSAAVKAGRKAKSKRTNGPIKGLPAIVVVCLLGLFLVSVAFRLFSSDAAFASANRHFARGDFNAAQAAYEQSSAFRGEPTYRRVYGSRLGVAAVAVGDQGGASFIAQARDAFDFVNDLPHVNSIVDYARVMIAWSEFEPEAGAIAVDLYRRAVELDPNDPALLSDAAGVFVEQGDYEAAVAVLTPRVDVFDRAELWGALALAHANLGDREEATAAIETALALLPGDPRALQAQQLLEGNGP